MMPQMKGPEVVEKLKKIPGFQTPVVALTADVITGLEDKYIEQGFDDCMSKPIIEEDLYYMLKKYLKSNDIVPETIQISETNIEQTQRTLDTSILEQAGINVKASLIQLKDIDTYNRTITEFYDQLDTNILTLFDHKNTDNIDKYYVCSSEMKKQALKLGFNNFATILAEHETAAKEKNTEYITSNFSKIKMESLTVKSIIKKYIGR
jgi:response regulator RpfG family c-di-GMP phosphodiesterase